MHYFADVKSIFDSLPVVDVETNSRFVDFDFISLVILKITTVDHPKVEIDVKIKSHLFSILNLVNYYNYYII